MPVDGKRFHRVLLSYYSVYGMFATHLQKDLQFTPAMVATPLALSNLVAFFASGFWGWIADRHSRRWAMIIPAFIGIFITPLYIFTKDYEVIAITYIVQGAFLGAIYGQNPSYLSQRFPTEVRATASGFCYHQGAVRAGFTGSVLAIFAAGPPLGFAIPMMVATIARPASSMPHGRLTPEFLWAIALSAIEGRRCECIANKTEERIGSSGEEQE